MKYTIQQAVARLNELRRAAANADDIEVKRCCICHGHHDMPGSNYCPSCLPNEIGPGDLEAIAKFGSGR